MARVREDYYIKPKQGHPKGKTMNLSYLAGYGMCVIILCTVVWGVWLSRKA